MSVRSVFPRRAVFQSATPADRTSYRSSSLGVVRARAARACVPVWRDVPRKACASWHGEACRRKKEAKSAGQRRTKDKGPRQERKLRACRRVWGCHSPIAHRDREQKSHVPFTSIGRTLSHKSRQNPALKIMAEWALVPRACPFRKRSRVALLCNMLVAGHPARGSLRSHSRPTAARRESAGGYNYRTRKYCAL